MSYIPEEYTPKPDEIDEVLGLYNEWLEEAYNHHGDKEKALNVVTQKIQIDQEAGRVFRWMADNDASLIYDVDESLKDDRVEG